MVGIGSFGVLCRELSGFSTQVPFCWQYIATVASLCQWNPIAFSLLSQIARCGTMYKWPPSIQQGDTPNQTWLTPRCLIVQIFSCSSLLYTPLANRNARLFFCAFHVCLRFTSSLEYYGSAHRRSSNKRRKEFLNLSKTKRICVI